MDYQDRWEILVSMDCRVSTEILETLDSDSEPRDSPALTDSPERKESEERWA